MPKDGLLIAGLVLLCVSAAGADQLLHWRIRSAPPPAVRHAEASLSILPVSFLGSAIAVGAQHRLDRPLPPDFPRKSTE
jgi:hypothetical protein